MCQSKNLTFIQNLLLWATYFSSLFSFIVNMRKYLYMMLCWAIGILLNFGSTFATDYLKVKFDNWDNVYLDITKSSTGKYKLSVNQDNLGKNSTLRCYLILPDFDIHSFSDCEWSFSYSSSSTKNVILSAVYITKDKTFYSERMPAKINFKNGTWGSSSNVVSSSSSSSSSSNSKIELSTNRNSPSTSQYVNLTIDTSTKYTGKVYLSAKYRSSSSASRSTISNTSTTYFSDYSDEWDNGYYKMTSSDKGEVTLKNLVKFKKSGYYRIYVEDTDGNESYIQFSVDKDSSTNNDLEISASPSSPDTYEWVKVTIETDDDYTGKINFSKLQYKSSSSSSWSSISRTSGTYVSDYSSEWSNWYYKMTSSDDWYVTLKNLVKFKKSGYYRIYIEDTDGNDAYVQINVDTSSSSSDDDIELSTNRKSPSTNQYVNLTIETPTKYTGKLYLSAKYRSSSSSSWSSISNTSSTYFSDYSDEWDNGYYKMTSSDKGEVTLKSLVKFKKKWYYRIYVEDTDDNENYIQFSVGVSDDDDDDDEVDWFSAKELSKVKDVYDEWNSMIAQMQAKYTHLKRDTYWIKLSNNFYDDMEDIIDNKKNRDLEDYDDFQEAFNDWYEYTMRNI